MRKAHIREGREMEKWERTHAFSLKLLGNIRWYWYPYQLFLEIWSQHHAALGYLHWNLALSHGNWNSISELACFEEFWPEQLKIGSSHSDHQRLIFSLVFLTLHSSEIWIRLQLNYCFHWEHLTGYLSIGFGASTCISSSEAFHRCTSLHEAHSLAKAKIREMQTLLASCLSKASMPICERTSKCILLKKVI